MSQTNHAPLEDSADNPLPEVMQPSGGGSSSPVKEGSASQDKSGGTGG